MASSKSRSRRRAATRYLLSGAVGDEYWPQIQGQLWITERAWVDIMSYCPEMPEAVVRVARDEAYIDGLPPQSERFRQKLIGLRQRHAIAGGFVNRKRREVRCEKEPRKFAADWPCARHSASEVPRKRCSHASASRITRYLCLGRGSRFWRRGCFHNRSLQSNRRTK